MSIVDTWFTGSAEAPPPPVPPTPGEISPYTTWEWWEVDGIVLNTYAFNISTLGGREQLPPMRGENVQVGNRPGRRWVPKVPDERIISLAMWVRGSDENGDVSAEQRPLFQANWEYLKRLFGRPYEQMVLKRRIMFPDGVVERVALAEIAGTMDLEPQGPSSGAFVVDLKMADPFWYAPQESLTVSLAQVSTGGFFFPVHFPLFFDEPYVVQYSSVDFEVDYPGVYPTSPRIHIDGPVENPSIWHSDSGARLTLELDLLVDESLDFDFVEKRITLTFAGGQMSVRNLLQAGSSWFELQRGINHLRFDGVSGSGIVTVTYRPNHW